MEQFESNAHCAKCGKSNPQQRYVSLIETDTPLLISLYGVFEYLENKCLHCGYKWDSKVKGAK